LVDRWLAIVDEHLLSHWHRNAAAHGPGGYRHDASSSWVRDRLRLIKAEIDATTHEHILNRDLHLVTSRVEKRAAEAAPVLERQRLYSPTGEFKGWGQVNPTGHHLAGVDVKPLVGVHKVQHFRIVNVRLIKSLAGKQLDTIHDVLEKSESVGARVEDLRDELMSTFGVTKAKAALLARDQTLKLHSAITQERQQQAGIAEYRWSTSRDERVRGRPGGKWPDGLHWQLEGKIFRWDDPPVISKDGRRGHPGEDYQCRCVAVPILPKLE
jgi:SPP1 gp7 family putative phage head morphogenesis protein